MGKYKTNKQQQQKTKQNKKQNKTLVPKWVIFNFQPDVNIQIYLHALLTAFAVQSVLLV